MKVTRIVPALLALLAGMCSAADVPAPAKKGPVPAAESADRMTVPEGFRVTLFAGEPDVRQPIAFTFDDRGRLWVAECDSYPVWLTPGEPKRDRVVIFEDTDGDGKFDSRKVFWDKAQNLTGIELGFGGVWLCSTPNLLFVPDKNGDDVPDAEPTVVLDGWDVKAQHNMFNGLAWGPDGWLWGCNGIMSNSKVGRPGAKDAARVAMNCGVWRYHPARQVFEVVANGTTNPWGLDFDDRGEAFITNCVLPHLYHVTYGAHFERMYGQEFRSHLYELMPTCADHIHWGGGNWTDSRGGKGKHGEAGGGHAHVGAMIYLGGSWPDTYRNNVFTCNLHGNRINRDLLRREGSGYVAGHAPDFLLAHDEWYRGIALKYGPDGSAFVLDWSDTDECHDTDGNGPERATGRIHRVSHGTPDQVAVDLSKAGEMELVGYQRHKNEWFARHARRILQERHVSGSELAEAAKGLREILDREADIPLRLRALFALVAIAGIQADDLVRLSNDQSEDVRTWAVRLLAHEGPIAPAALARFRLMAEQERSPRVRLALASALMRIEPDAPTIEASTRFAVARSLVAWPGIADDPTLPLMTWYAVEPLAATGSPEVVDLATLSRAPLLGRYLARRLVDAAEESPDHRGGLAKLVAVLGDVQPAAKQVDLLTGMREAYKGRKSARMPSEWVSAASKLNGSGDAEVREQSLLLGMIYGDPDSGRTFRATMKDSRIPTPRRARALEALVEHRMPGLAADLRGLLDDSTLRPQALRALAAFDDPKTAPAILERYQALNDGEKADAVATLAGRPATALALLDAVASGAIPRRDLSANVARQILAIRDPALAQKLESAWGTLRPTSGQKVAAMAKYKEMLAPDKLRDADPGRGKLVFAKTCASCHKLYDAGGNVGPELTGSDRANLDYLLENVLDPSAVVGKDFKLTNVATTDGRLVSGILREQTNKTLTIRTANETITLPREDVEEVRPSDVSMMPEGLFEAMTEGEVRDLVAYLKKKEQATP